MKKDKIKVLDEVLSEERIKSFLHLQAPEGETPDFNRLLKAYRGMPPQYFELFLEFFSENNSDINARSRDGKTILDVVQTHKQSGEYAALLIQFGAK